MTNPDREELVKLNEAGLEAAVRECARITAPEITDDEYEQIKADNSPRYQNTRTEMARAIRAYLRAAKPALSSIVTCCVTGAIPGDGGACGDCDPCLLGEASVPAPVKTLIAEKNSLIHRVGELEDELDSLRRLASSDSGVAPDWAGYEALKTDLSPTLGGARAVIIARLQILFERATAGPWHQYQNGVHPVEVGGMASGKDYAICTHGPDGFDNATWISAIHNDWPMIVASLRELATGRAALEQEGK